MVKHIGQLTVFSKDSAMHGAIELYTKHWGYLCFRPTTKLRKIKFKWYFYASPDATPGHCTLAVGPGLDYSDKLGASIRKQAFGHNFQIAENDEKLRIVRDCVEQLQYRVMYHEV